MNTDIKSRRKNISSENLLQFLCNNGIINLEDVLENIETMKNLEIIQQHPYKISQGSNKRWYTYLPDKRRPHGRRQIAKSTRESIEKAIIEDYKKRVEEESLENMNLEKLYQKWMIWRRNNGTDPKTILENSNDWKRFLSNHPLRKKRIKDIELADIEDFFLSITKNHSITYKRLTNIKSVLNGIFKYALRLKIINHNTMVDLDYKQFHTRCKPTSSNKQNYTEEERKQILEYLSCKKDIYSQAIKLAFYLCLRIGELVSIKKEDIQGNEIFINRSTRRHQKMNDDLSFGKTEYTIEERIKGNQKEGFRSIPLTKKAQEIVAETIQLYPEGEYLFMRDRKPIYGDTFNRHLKSICKALDIPYRSSHQIRFTMATTLYEGGVKINQLSTFLGHSDTRTTFHYIRQKKADEHASQIMTDILDI